LKTIKRTVAVLNYLARARVPSGVTEISKSLGLSKGTISRLLSDLEEEQMVARDCDSHRFTLGVKLMELGLVAQSKVDLRSASLPYMHQLRDATGETVGLILRVGMERMYIEQVQGTYEVRQVAELGKKYPLWAGGGGKVMLAYLEDREVEVVMDSLRKSGVRTLASGQILDIDRLQDELKEIRERGFAVTVGERLPSFCGVCAPIFDSEHRVVGSLSIGGPLPRFGFEEGTRLGPLVREAARKISLHLGDLAPDVKSDSLLGSSPPTHKNA
jgi:DNA-binding IclR family transcriptional regulator